jgi:hypothetical protein
VAEQARVANDRRGETVARVAAAQSHVQLAGSAGALDELEALAREALPELEEAGDHAGLMRVWRSLGWVANFHGRYEEYTQAAEYVVFHARQIDRPSLFGLPFALVLGPRPVDEALQAFDPLLRDDLHPIRRLRAATDGWNRCWAEHAQAWRTEPEFDEHRQAELATRRAARARATPGGVLAHLPNIEGEDLHLCLRQSGVSTSARCIDHWLCRRVHSGQVRAAS